MGTNVKVEKNVNGVDKGQMVYCGNTVPFAVAGELEISGKKVDLNFRNLREVLTNTYKWNIELEGFTFVTYVAGKGDNFTDMVKDGKIFISNLTYQSIKRIAISKNWAESKLHNEYLTATGRKSQSTAIKHTTGKI